MTDVRGETGGDQVGLLQEYKLEELNESRRSILSRSSSDETLLPISESSDIIPEKAAHTRDHSANTILSLLQAYALAFLVGLIPSLLHRSQETKKLHPTAYLDGLRGVAAFMVFIHHTILDWYPALSRGYGSSTPQNSHFFLQLPLIRIVYSGRGMVSVFFVISGYVLSHKAIRLMRAAQYPALLDSLSSSVFRRGMRLFLPITASTFISMLFSYWGWYIQDPQGHNVIPPRKGDFRSQVKDWWHHVVLLWNPLVNVDGRALYSPPYDGHLWTIPIEYHGSIIVFLALLCVAKMRPWLRLCALTGFSVYSLWETHWEVFLFLTGALLCDIHFARDSISIPSFLAKIPALPRFIAAEAALFAVALFATHLLCYPDELASVTPSYRTIVSITPHSMSSAGLGQRFWLAVGATLLVAAMDISPLLQAPFTTRIAQYLGRISFALYIVHGPVLYTLGMKMLYAAKPIWDGEGGWGKFFLAAVGAWIVDLIVSVYAADVFWRAFDVSSVRFAGWVAGKVWDRKTAREGTVRASVVEG